MAAGAVLQATRWIHAPLSIVEERLVGCSAFFSVGVMEA
jgi:hypothetical protein